MNTAGEIIDKIIFHLVESHHYLDFLGSLSPLPEALILDNCIARKVAFTDPISIYLGWNFTKSIDVRISLSLSKLTK